MKPETKILRNQITDSLLNSYGQVFFSKNKVFALILVVVSFFDLYTGLAGLIAVLTANGTALFMGMNRDKIIGGAYGFNALMVGLGIGINYQPTAEFYLILVFISLFTFFVTLSLEGVLGKYGLPYLSIPFLLGIWVVIIATKGYSELTVSERGVYYLNDMYALGGMPMVRLYEWFNELGIPESLRIYFKSLSAILFQYHLFAGLLLAAGLIYYSRIAFLMSLIGFYSAFIFYKIIGANISELSYSYIGFNYILTSIAVGGFFIVSSKRATMWVILLTPLVAITLNGTAYVFSHFGLSVYSLPFNMIVILFLYVIKFRERNFEKLAAVTFQQDSPELNAYGHKSYMSRFGTLPWFSIKLPFWGEWSVTQAHDGEITHRNEWRHAFDFEIVDQDNSTFLGSGDLPEDYYCFGKPVTAPGDGVVAEIENEVPDNIIGDINTEKNWGNTIVIKHGDHFYSQLSHLKKGSVAVTPGQAVKQGDLLAHCGNSGRSPYPHLHMQFQATPYIGSHTISYPFSSYVVNNLKQYQFNTSGIPVKGQHISNALPDVTLQYGFHLIPGATLAFKLGNKKVIWDIETDPYNNSYIKCAASGSVAWFKNVGDVFYFTGFKGKQDSLLYYFYLAAYKVSLSFYKNLQLHDQYPLSVYPNKGIKIIQDFAIPFAKILNADYQIKYEQLDDMSSNRKVALTSTAHFGIGKKSIKKYSFRMEFNALGISVFEINTGSEIIVAGRTLEI